jgi:hypothetical protein
VAHELLMHAGTMKFLAQLAFTSLSLLVACTSSEGTSATALEQEPGNCGSLETHVFGEFRAPDGLATVRISRPGTHAIIVTGYEPIEWTITTEGGAELEAIYAVGVKKQTVHAPPGVQVVSEYKQSGDPYGCADGYPLSSPGCDTKNLMDLVEHRVHAITSLHACHEATHWELGSNMAVTSDCGTLEGKEQQDMVKGCTGEDSCGGPIFL